MAEFDFLQVCRGSSRRAGPHSCDSTVFNICCLLMDEKGWNPPVSSVDGVQLYMNIRNEIRASL